ncbi:MAG: hypothetical protein Q4A23_01655 [bacterium]|nr:hypothetical protein [bacterium]
MAPTLTPTIVDGKQIYKLPTSETTGLTDAHGASKPYSHQWDRPEER